ncbi:phosphoglycerate kinase [Actibacterium atlanticum]|uniref:Phosphoglycerate kinase n=1 Tax=Actibacterium atlanticum TaxID=1461693 RepID=A0A058ZI08_9RHOB|nr:phosphoglycerate kinase [Actibacterium atlanticum]KCV80832.1 phosphoglycerate kinase [Actibacterium atlanticum]
MDITPIMDMDVKGKRLLVRADLNVPVQDGFITDDTRIKRFAEGMRPLLERGARLVILTHMGRPNGNLDSSLSVDKLRPALAKHLGVPVTFSDISAGPAAEINVSRIGDGEVILCENVRYNPGEEQNDPELAAQFARLGDIYVNDAFSCAHRAHASTAAITNFLPSAAGPLLLAELKALSTALETPQSPAVAIVGGAKVSTKIAVLKHLVQKLDAIIVGGGMANTFLFARGAPMGRSLHEANMTETVAEIYALARASGCEILLPEDVVVAKEFREGARKKIVPWDKCPDDSMILDAGTVALRNFQGVLASAQTILWNGPLGAFEIPPFDHSTMALSETAAELTRAGLAVSVAGGGDTVAALNTAGVADEFTYVSTAGGAFLEWLEGKTLPGIAALMNAQKAA